MSWSYDVAALPISVKDQIRLRLGDTDEVDPVMQDEEIQYYIGDSNVLTDSILLNCLDACIIRISGLPDYQLGPYSESHQARLNAWNALKKELESQAHSQHAPISEAPTTAPIFGYDLMSVACCAGGGNSNER